MGTNVSRIRLTLAFCIFLSPCSQNQIEATTRSQTLTSICWALLLFSSMMSLVVLWSFSTSAWSCKIACWALLRASLSYGHTLKIRWFKNWMILTNKRIPNYFIFYSHYDNSYNWIFFINGIKFGLWILFLIRT